MAIILRFFKCINSRIARQKNKRMSSNYQNLSNSFIVSTKELSKAICNELLQKYRFFCFVINTKYQMESNKVLVSFIRLMSGYMLLCKNKYLIFLAYIVGKV